MNKDITVEEKELSLREKNTLEQLKTVEPLSIEELNYFKEGIYSLRTRRFGDVAEIMIRKFYKLERSADLAYDSIDIDSNKVEIKFSTVMKKNGSNINENNVIKSIFDANSLNRAMNYADLKKETFDCNIQQIKPVEFDYLYYGLFLGDCVLIFRMSSQDVLNDPNIGYSNKQHRNNEGEGQFHIKRNNIDYHLDTYLEQTLSYHELYELLSI